MTKPVVLQHFQILQRPDGSLWELGHGAMGVTYRAMDMELGGTVALKVINSAYLHNERARERFLREARAAAYLNHPNVASVFHLGREGDSFFYAMEFVEGETLAALVARQGALPARLALRMVLQVANGLAVANDRGLVHRDIKPENLMVVRHEPLGEDGDDLLIKVIDFGLAKSSHQEENNISLTGGSPVGTPAYMSPEQIEPTDAGVDARSDIYSLGATLWNLLTGKPPFTGTSFFVLGQHLHTPPPTDKLAAAGVPSGVVDLLNRMLAKKPADRPAGHRELIGQIKALLAALPVPASNDADASVTLALSVEGNVYPPTGHPGSGFSATHLAPTAGFSLLELLRCRGALPVGEVLRLLEPLAVEVDLARREGPLELKPEAVQLRFELPANLDHLPHQPVFTWPTFTFLLRAKAEDTVQMTMTVEQTMVSDDPVMKGADDLTRLTLLTYELLSGKVPNNLGQYHPIPALGESGNDVLGYCMKSSAVGRHAFENAVEFRRMLTDAVQSSGILYSHPHAVHSNAHTAGHHPSSKHHLPAPHHTSPMASGHPAARTMPSMARDGRTAAPASETHATTGATATPSPSAPVIIHHKTPAIVWVLIALLAVVVGLLFWRETLHHPPAVALASPAASATPATPDTPTPAATASAEQVRRRQLQQEEERQEQMLATQEAHAKAARTWRVPGDHPTVQAAIDAAEPGDTVQIAPGRYPEAVHFKEGVRLIGSSRDTVRVVTTANTTAFAAENCRFGLVSDITFEQSPGSSTTAFQPAVTFKNSSLQFLRCRVRNSAVYGIYIRGNDHSRVEDCEVTGASSDGIHVMDEGALPTIKGNRVADNQMNGIFFHMLGGGSVEDNVVQHNGGSGIAMMGEGVAPRLDNNKFTGNKKWGIEIGKPAAPMVAPNNVSTGNGLGPSYEGDIMEKM